MKRVIFYLMAVIISFGAISKARDEPILAESLGLPIACVGFTKESGWENRGQGVFASDHFGQVKIMQALLLYRASDDDKWLKAGEIDTDGVLTWNEEVLLQIDNRVRFSRDGFLGKK